MGWDLMELTAHSGARPEHAHWQGKIVSRSGQKGYLSLRDIRYGEATGFKGVNCRHDWYPYYKGSARTYTQKQLNKWKNEKVTYNGQKISMYEATQKQRYFERKIRQDKKDLRAQQAVLTSKDKNIDIDQVQAEIRNIKAKQNNHNAHLDDFLNQTGLRKDINRLFI